MATNPARKVSSAPRKRAAAKTAAGAKKQATQKPPADEPVETPSLAELLDVPEFESIHHRIAWVQSIVENVEKTGKMERFNYGFIQEHGTIAATNQLLAVAGLGSRWGMLPELCSRQGNLFVGFGRLTVFDHQGDEVSEIYAAEGQDQGDKAAYKAQTAGHKYALQKFFKLKTEKLDDADYVASADLAEQAEAAKPKQTDVIEPKRAAELHATIQEAIGEEVIDGKKILARMQGEYNVQRVSELTPAQADDFEKWFAAQVSKGLG